jgi:hypothetical protein
MTSTSSWRVSPTPVPEPRLTLPLPLPFLLIATLLLPSRNSSSRPGVPTRMSAPVSKNCFLSSWSELPPIRRSAGATGVALVAAGGGAVEVEGSSGFCAVGCAARKWLKTEWI